MKTVEINTEFIKLQQLLKMEGIIGNGGEAKFFLADNICYFNGEPEQRRGKKLRDGDIVKVLENEYLIKNAN